MDPSPGDGQSLFPSFVKHAENYPEDPEVLVFMVYLFYFVKRKKEGGEMGREKSGT